MAISLNTIAETAIADEGQQAVISNLLIELFSDVAFSRLAADESLSLDLDLNINEVYPSYQAGGPWFLGLEVAAAAAIEQIFQFVDTAVLELSDNNVDSLAVNIVETLESVVGIDATETIVYDYTADTALVTDVTTSHLTSYNSDTSGSLSADGDYFHTFTLLSNEVIPLSIEIIEKTREDDTPSELWRDRPGTPIGPISLSPIGVEQFSDPITFRVYNTDVDPGVLSIGGDADVRYVPDYKDPAELEINEDSPTSSSRSTIDSVSLGTVTIYSKSIVRASDETVLADIEVFDQIQNVFSFTDAAELVSAATSIDNRVSLDISSGGTTLAAMTYVKDYTFYTQGSEEIVVPLSVSIESETMYIRQGTGGGLGRIPEIWISNG
jgi:hypothetical protein